MKIKLLLILAICLSCSAAMAQTNNTFLTNLCQRWQLETIEMEETGHKFPPDTKMAQNYLQFNPDGVFKSMENGVTLNGKWRADEMTKELVTYEFDNQNLTSPVIFTIVSLTKTKLAIANSPIVKDRVIMHYAAKKAPKKKTR